MDNVHIKPGAHVESLAASRVPFSLVATSNWDLKPWFFKVSGGTTPEGSLN